MKTYTENAIILRRINYGEADRIITFLTPQKGQVAGIAKGVRKPKSKLAGGLELFSVSTVTFLISRGDLDIVRSTRLVKHFGNIISDYDRMSLGYQVIEVMNTITSDVSEPELYAILEQVLGALDVVSLPLPLIESWFYINIVNTLGQRPNLATDTAGKLLDSEALYAFDEQDGAFHVAKNGTFGADHIKTWRLLLSADVMTAARVSGIEQAVIDSAPVLRRFFKQATNTN